MPHTLAHSVPIRPQTPCETRAGTAAPVMARSLQEGGQRGTEREREKEGGGLGIMRGYMRTDEEGKEEDHWTMAGYTLYRDCTQMCEN